MGNKGYSQGYNEDILPFREDLFEIVENGSGYLKANRCKLCGINFFPKREFCIKCFKTDQLEEVKLSRYGRLHTFTVVHRTVPDFPTPYIIGYVDLEEDGVRIFAQIDDCKQEDLQIGMEMELTFGTRIKKPADQNDKRLLTYKFRPVK